MKISLVNSCSLFFPEQMFQYCTITLWWKWTLFCIFVQLRSLVTSDEEGRVRRSNSQVLKEQYPVTAHAPNFDFWTGCREIKRCEESKRILKNPFASRLARSIRH